MDTRLHPHPTSRGPRGGWTKVSLFCFAAPFRHHITARGRSLCQGRSAVTRVPRSLDRLLVAVQGHYHPAARRRSLFCRHPPPCESLKWLKSQFAIVRSDPENIMFNLLWVCCRDLQDSDEVGGLCNSIRELKWKLRFTGTRVAVDCNGRKALLRLCEVHVLSEVCEKILGVRWWRPWARSS